LARQRYEPEQVKYHCHDRNWKNDAQRKSIPSVAIAPPTTRRIPQSITLFYSTDVNPADFTEEQMLTIMAANGEALAAGHAR
jgi:hypothetical protein